MNVGTAAVSPDPAGRGAQREKPRATSALSGQNRRMTSPALDDLRMPAGRRVEPAHRQALPFRASLDRMVDPTLGREAFVPVPVGVADLGAHRLPRRGEFVDRVGGLDFCLRLYEVNA